jgi:chemotaxis receptor (MCP) glutamine deamidase CheD
MSAPQDGTGATKCAREKHVTLYLGGVHASDEPIIIKTLLGSCVAVCLHDPVAHAGGMNHFMLPRGQAEQGDPTATRFGVHAMDRLLAAVMKAGAVRRRLVAKVFGGAHVLDLAENSYSVPRQNAAFAREFLLLEGFPVRSWDVGGSLPREVYFYPQSGRAFVRRVRRNDLRQRVVDRERRTGGQAPPFGSVTFFDQE